MKRTFYASLPRLSKALLEYALQLVVEEEIPRHRERVWWLERLDGVKVRLE